MSRNELHRLFNILHNIIDRLMVPVLYHSSRRECMGKLLAVDRSSDPYGKVAKQLANFQRHVRQTK